MQNEMQLALQSLSFDFSRLLVGKLKIAGPLQLPCTPCGQHTVD